MATQKQFPNEFARFAGEMAENLNFNRSLGQIYGILFVHSGPMSLDQIAEDLLMSKGNASVNLRILEQWGAVRRVSKSGTRKDYYEANRAIKEIALRRLQEGLSRRLNHAEESLGRFVQSLENDPSSDETRKRVQSLHTLVSSGRRALEALPKLLKFLP